MDSPVATSVQRLFKLFNKLLTSLRQSPDITLDQPWKIQKAIPDVPQNVWTAAVYANSPTAMVGNGRPKEEEGWRQKMAWITQRLKLSWML
ncbi:hypothetical protein SKAU_G00138050 [Synaphobranchus kaupii]|uniref:Uncharacterized protein n=1 Tax=Synaphobranchus kaupii TaxID=118154 RepID=A0A9Q1FS09_SYNKA|nr:hypothetical protein SKAU_G00138050 [Synaphobranchus kaupii]